MGRLRKYATEDERKAADKKRGEDFYKHLTAAVVAFKILYADIFVPLAPVIATALEQQGMSDKLSLLNDIKTKYNQVKSYHG